MSSTYPEALLVEPVEQTERLEDEGEEAELRSLPKTRGGFLAFVLWLFAWLWRWFVGALFCMLYITSIFVVGWTYRWMQALALKTWWKKSRFAREGSFSDYCDSLQLNAPVPRPRWFWRERIRQTLAPEKYGKKRPIASRQFFRIISVPWFSLWQNFWTGFKALFCIYLLTGPGCLLMHFGWIYGWQISFHKVYEEAGFGPGIFLLGAFLFSVALCYVLMAQVHQAVTGEARSFFHFRFVWRLIRTRPLAYFFLLSLLVLASLPLEIMKSIVFIPIWFGNNPNLTDAEVLQYFQRYLFGCSLFLFLVLLLLRGVAVKIYCSAVLKALKKGWLTQDDLHPKIRKWLEHLEIKPVPQLNAVGVVPVARAVGRWKYRNLVLAATLFAAMVFSLKTVIGEFLNYHPVFDFTNHVLVQFPALDYVPGHLRTAAAKEK